MPQLLSATCCTVFTRSAGPRTTELVSPAQPPPSRPRSHGLTHTAKSRPGPPGQSRRSRRSLARFLRQVSRHRGVGGEGDGVDEAVRYHRRADTAVEREGPSRLTRGGGGERGTAVRLDAILTVSMGWTTKSSTMPAIWPATAPTSGRHPWRSSSTASLDGIRRATFVPSLPTETNMRTKTRAERRGMREALTDDPPTARTGAVTGTSTLLK